MNNDEQWSIKYGFEHIQKSLWKGLGAIGAVHSKVTENELTRTETRYFLTSLTDVNRFAQVVRKHWSIENQLHWQLDVTFGEDSSKTRKDNSPLNWNVMRKTALPLIRKADVGKNRVSNVKCSWPLLMFLSWKISCFKSKCFRPAFPTKFLTFDSFCV